MTFREPFVVIVNPRAGAARAARRVPALREALRAHGASFEMIETKARGDATKLVREMLSRGVQGIAIVGGDGTLNEAVNGFFGPSGERIETSAWLAPFPAGTGGDFCRSLRIPDEIEAMVAHIANAEARAVDVGWASYTREDGAREARAFLNIASFGLSAVVVRGVESMPKQIGGRTTYFLGALLGMTRYTPSRVRLSFDGEERETEILSMAVANAAYFGGGMHIAPGADLRDGLLDVVGLEHISKLKSLSLTSALYKGRILSVPGVTHRRVKRLSAESMGGASIFLELDGEAPGLLPASFDVVASAIRLRA